MSVSVLVVGDQERLVKLIKTVERDPEAGYPVVAACCSDEDGDFLAGRVPVLGNESEAAAIALRQGVDAVACTSSRQLSAGGSGASAGTSRAKTSGWWSCPP